MAMGYLRRLASICAILIIASLSTPVSAVTTCHEDEQGNKTCCESWKSVVFAKGKKYGLLQEDTYDKLARKIASDKKDDISYCKFSGGQSSSCSTIYGPPECYDKTATRLPPGSEENAIVLNIADRLLDEWGDKISDARSRYNDLIRDRVGRNPYENIGKVTMEYGKVLNDILDQQKQLRDMLKEAHQKVTERLLRNIDALTKDLDQSTRRLPGVHKSLPDDIQKQLPLPIPDDTSPSAAGNTTPSADRKDSSSSQTNSNTTATGSRDSCPDLTNCLKLVDSTWDDAGLRRQGIGRMTVKVANTCSQPLRLALWMPQGAGYTPTYFQLSPGGTTSQSATGTRNEWQMQASQASASDACLNYP